MESNQNNQNNQRNHSNLSKIRDIMREKHQIDLFSYGQDFLMKIFENRQKAAASIDEEDYLKLLHDKNEAKNLFESLQISYTSFFREPLTFAFLEQIVFPKVIANKSKGGQIRIWSAGCAGGQEAYSVAMILSDLLEIAGKEPSGVEIAGKETADKEIAGKETADVEIAEKNIAGKKITFRIFATDISEKALEEGRSGVYNESLVQEVKIKHLHKYFEKDGKNYVIKKSIRDSIDFYRYDMLAPDTTHPPESIYGDFDLVICSNLLIYYNPVVQQKIINKLKKSVSDTGYLITGESEKMLFQHHKELQMLSAPNSIFKIDRRRG